MDETVHKTRDYDQFKFIVGNRPINPGLVKLLTKSIEKKNLLALRPIDVNDSFQVIDGQHRLFAAKRLGVEIYFKKLPATGGNLQQIHTLQNQKAWSMNDWLASYIALGGEDYEILGQFTKKWQLPLTVSGVLLMGEGARPETFITLFKEGQFQVGNLAAAEDIAKKLTELKPYTEGTVWKNRDFIEAVIKAMKKIPQEKLLKKLAMYNRKIEQKASIRDYLRALEDAYNYHQHNTVRLY